MFLWRRVAPQSPEDGLKPTAAPGYARNFRTLNRLIAQGKSFSGYEKNILFLNLNGRRFADIASPLEVDFDDDSRAVATTDWDGDGGLDIWVTNRTGPRVRLLHNGAAQSRPSLSVRLIGNGTTTNRDAVGARLTLWPETDPKARQLRTVRAGDGFLSQSSAWNHFGLGTEAAPCSLAISWPGGRSQTLTGLKPNQRYLIRQDAESPPESRPLTPAHPRPAATPLDAEETSASGFWTASRVPLPPLPYTDDQGNPRSTESLRGRPALINLWATWCAPCLKELSEFASDRAALDATGATVLALNVDTLATEQRSDGSDNPALVLQQLGYPFSSGLAHPESLAKIELLIEFLSARRQPLTVPTSLLIDAEGGVAAVYFTPVSSDQLADDIALLKAPAAEQLRRLSPRPGRWLADPRQIDRATFLGDCATLFATNGFANDAQHLRQSLAPRDGKLTARELYNQAKTAAQQRNSEEAARLYHEALELQPDYGEALTGLGALLLIQNRPEEARPYFEKALALDPNHATALINMAMIDQRRGDTESALSRLNAVIARNPDYPEAHLNLGSLLASLKRHEDAIRHLTKATELNPKLLPAHLNLASAFMETGQWTRAEHAFHQAANLNPRLPFPHAGLGACLARQTRHAEAIESYRTAQSLGGSNPQTYTQLALSQHALGDTAGARQSLVEALRLDPSYAPAKQALESLADSPN